MNVYVAASYHRDRRSASQLIDLLIAAGHSITFDWTYDQLDADVGLAMVEIEAAGEADALVLIWGESLLGALLETGVALGRGKQVVVVGEPRESIFWQLPNVTVVETEDDALAYLERVA